MTEILVWGSSLGFLCLVLSWSIQRRNVRPFIWALITIAIVLGMLTSTGLIPLPWKEDLTSRGESQRFLIVILYGAMIVGMIAHYLFFHLSRSKKRRRKIDWGNLLAPVLVSPIIFLPLAAVFDSVESYPTTADASRLMLFLVAFENGFFWREFFENRKKAWDQVGEGQ